MTQPLSPDQCSPDQRQELLAGYVLYNLSPEEAALLAALLAQDPTLQQDIDRLQQTLEFAYESDSVTPPAPLRSAVLGSVSAPVPAAIAAVPAPSRRPRRWGRMWGVAAAGLIAALGLSNLALWRTLQLERASRPAGDTLTVALASSEAPAQAQVVINPDTLDGLLTVENLPPLEPGSVYVLWTVVDPNAAETLDDKDAILTTVFTVDGQGNVSQPIDLPPVYRRDRSLVRAVAITKENAAAPQEHLAAPILIQPL